MSVLDNFFQFRWEANRKQWSGPPVEHLAEYSLAVRLSPARTTKPHGRAEARSGTPEGMIRRCRLLRAVSDHVAS